MTNEEDSEGLDRTASRLPNSSVSLLSKPAQLSGDLIVQFSDGRIVPLVGSLIVGRHPTPSLGAMPLSVVDPERKVSKTHLLIEPGPGLVWVTDLHSTNGVLLEFSDGSQLRLPRGIPTFVAASTRIRMGSMWLVVRKTSLL